MEVPTNILAKIFKSMVNLTFKDQHLEEKYNRKTKNTKTFVFNIFMKLVLIYIILMFIFVHALLMFEESERIRKILYKFLTYFSVILFIMIANFSIGLVKMNDYLKLEIQEFFLLFTFLSTHIGVYGISSTHYKANVEFIGFLYLIQLIIQSVICFFIFKRFIKNVYFILFNFIFQCTILMMLHVHKAAVYYLVINFFTNSVLLYFIYLSEYWMRVFFFNTYNKVEKERSYFLRAFNFLNISYFKIKDKTIVKQVKLDQIIKLGEMENLEMLIEQLISIDDIGKEVEGFFVECIKNKNFNFDKLIEKVLESKENTFFNDKFQKIGIIRILNDNNEASYYQLFLNLHLKKVNQKHTIEGFLLDVTQLYYKQQIQENSLVLSKYIHDIKSPLYLLETVIKKYKKRNNSLAIKVLSMVDFIYKNGFQSIFNQELLDKVLKKSQSIQIHSDYLKVISKNIYDIIGCINDFTMKQNKILNKQGNSLNSTNLKQIIILCTDFWKIYLKYNSNKDIKFKYLIEDNSIENIYTNNRITIKQVLMNLLSNAMKFTHKGEINIRAKMKEEGVLRLSVEDTGCGIDKENLQKIGKPFALTTDMKGGSGLGINIVHDLLSKIESKLEVHSKKNQGSSFSFEICSKYFAFNTGKVNHSNSSLSSENFELDSSSDSAENISKSKIRRLKRFKSQKMDEIEVVKEASRNEIDEANAETQQLDRHSNSINTTIFKSPLNINKDSSNYKLFISKCNQNDFSISFTSPISKQNKLQNLFSEGDLIQLIRKKSDSSYNNENFELPQTQLIKSNDKVSVNNSFKILIIDDEYISLSSFKNLINRISVEYSNEFIIDYSTNALEGLNYIYQNNINNSKYNVVFIDENMPYLKGSKFCKLYKKYMQSNGLYQVTFVSISGEALMFQNDPFYNNIFDYYLPKPFNKKALKAILNSIIG